MRGYELLEKMEYVDSGLILAAGECTGGNHAEKGKKEYAKMRQQGGAKSLLASACIMLCLAVIVFAGMRFITRDSDNGSVGNGGVDNDVVGNGGVDNDGVANGGKDVVNGNSRLPQLSISQDNDGAMGYEGYLAYDVSELISANPWSDKAYIAALPAWSDKADIAALPVYRNKVTYDEDFVPHGADSDKMRKILVDVAGRLGIDMENVEIKENIISSAKPDGHITPTEFIVETASYKLIVDAAMTVRITFKEPETLPDIYNYGDYATYDDMCAVADYLKEEYRGLIGFDNIKINITGGDYDIYGRQLYYIEYFDETDDLRTNIVNFNFNRAAFYCNDEGKLYIIRLFAPDLSDIVGDYPIITEEEALCLLEKGNYITSVPYEMTGTDYVRKVELIYRTGKREKYFMPYYRFLVELPQAERDNGLKNFGAYYVPAVKGEYIENMPVWDGGFN